jgi:hypothetical protein
MAACKIQKGIGVDCLTTLTAGTQDRLLLMSREDFISATYDTDFTGNNVLTAIVRKAGTKAYEFRGINNSNVARQNFARSDYFGAYTHEVDFIAFDMSPDTMAELERLNKDRVIAIVEDNNGWIRVYGLSNGLITTNNGGDTADEPVGGGHRISLQSTKEKGYAPYIGIYTGTAPNKIYDLEDSKAVRDGMLLAAS